MTSQAGRAMSHFTDRLRRTSLAQRLKQNSFALKLKQGVEALASPWEFVRGYRFASRIDRPRHAHSLPSPNPLEEYFDAYVEGPGIWKFRHYFDIYHRHLAKFRGQPVHILEIGVYSGGSLAMWRDYFGPESCIYGVDIEAACRCYESERTRIFIGDQADPDFWRGFLRDVPDIDVVIDDGSHRFYDQRASLQALLPHIRPGGVYICEDIHGAFHPFHAFVDGLLRPLNAVADASPSPLQLQVGSVHRYPLVTAIEKPATQVRDFEAPRHGTEWQPFLKAP